MSDYQQAMEKVREDAAQKCDDLAYLMENGAGEHEPGARLRQAARSIRVMPLPSSGQQDDWIAVTERLPEPLDEDDTYTPPVLCYCPDWFPREHVMQAAYAGDGAFSGWVGAQRDNVTHWRPLPESPGATAVSGGHTPETASKPDEQSVSSGQDTVRERTIEQCAQAMCSLCRADDKPVPGNNGWLFHYHGKVLCAAEPILALSAKQPERQDTPDAQTPVGQEAELQSGGFGESGFDRTQLIGAELLPTDAAASVAIEASGQHDEAPPNER